jgi:Tol biopolymer transport system component
MTLNDGFDRTVTDWLDEQAGHGMPGYLDEALARTTRTRQRPWWASLERWLPVQTTLRLSPAPRIAWLLLVVGLIAVLALAALVVGSRHRQPAPPFGLARNGTILYGGTDHDIHRLDPATGVTATLIAGSTGDRAPLLSPDGTRLLFLRDSTTREQGVGPFQPMIMVANDDGSDIRPLTGAIANFVDDVGNTAWSHDGSKVVVSSGPDSAPVLEVYSLDGSTKPVVIDTNGLAAGYVAFRPGGREITFRGMTSTGDGFYAVGADGQGLRTILPTTEGDGASLSPDGTKIAYQVWDGTTGVIHVVDVDTGIDTVPAFDPPSDAASIDAEPTWSPDGTRFLFVRFHGDGSGNNLMVAPSTGGRRIEIGPTMPNSGAYAQAQFSPDGSKVLVHYDADGSTWLLDPTGSIAGTTLSSTIDQAATWQRLAP